jgi:hypothetical protein
MCLTVHISHIRNRVIMIPYQDPDESCRSGSASGIRIILVTWIRIASNKNTDPHLDPHQIKITNRICIKVINWIRKRIRIHMSLHMTSQNVWNMSLFEHFFNGLSLCLEARIWIRIRISVMRIHNTDPDVGELNGRRGVPAPDRYGTGSVKTAERYLRSDSGSSWTLETSQGGVGIKYSGTGIDISKNL